MSMLNGKAKEVLDVCLSSESPEVRAKVYQIIDVSGLEPSDPMFLILALTGQMRVLLEAAPADLSKLLTDWKQEADMSLQQIQQAITQVRTTQIQQANTIRQTLETVSSNCVSLIKEAGMATTSAIAEANSETLSQAQLAARSAVELKDAVVALRSSVDQDRQTNEEVLKVLLKRIGQSTGGLETAIIQINLANEYIQKSNKDIQTLKKSTAFAQFIGSFSPLLALFVAMISGGLIWGWGMHMYWGEAERYLPVVKASQKAFELCYTPHGNSRPGVTCSVVAEKNKVKAKKK